jgi:hypothetical protein
MCVWINWARSQAGSGERGRNEARRAQKSCFRISQREEFRLGRDFDRQQTQKNFAQKEREKEERKREKTSVRKKGRIFVASGIEICQIPHSGSFRLEGGRTAADADAN